MANNVPTTSEGTDLLLYVALLAQWYRDRAAEAEAARRQPVSSEKTR